MIFDGKGLFCHYPCCTIIPWMKYIPVRYDIKFDEPPTFGARPEFVFRSALGFNLHRITCLQRRQESCAECMMRKTCVYSCFFESHVDKDGVALEGRDRASHPFVIEVSQSSDTDFSLLITFIGIGCNYIPYISMAMERSGKSGVGRSRTHFTVLSVTSAGDTIDETLGSVSSHLRNWPSAKKYKSPLAIEMQTPVRLKKEGKYIEKIKLQDFLVSISRRMRILLELYGDNEALDADVDYETLPESIAVGQRWVERKYHSSRQKASMILGGVVGSIAVFGEIGEPVQKLLEASELFHVGKNISFGLGKVTIKSEMEGE